jgi:predicted Zn-dependent protease with MMP-like domain
MPVELGRAEFEELVADALDEIPDEIAALIQNVVVLVEDDAPDDDPTLLGLYDGVALVDRIAGRAAPLQPPPLPA